MNNDMSQQSKSVGWFYTALIVIHIAASLAVSFLVGSGIHVSVSVQLIISELTVLGPALIYILIKNLDFKRDLGFKKIKFTTFLMTLLFGLVIYPVISFVNIISQLFTTNEALEMSGAFAQVNPVVLVLIVGFVAPFCEELAFRGIIYCRFKKVTSVILAGLINGILFGVMHMNLNQCCYAFCMGAIFALINEASGSIWTSMILHMVYNSLNTVALLFELKNFSKMGLDIEKLYQSTVSSDLMYYMAGAFLILAVIGAVIAIPIIGFIASNEGNGEVFAALTKRPEGSVSKSTCVSIGIGTAVGIAICLLMMIVPPGTILALFTK